MSALPDQPVRIFSLPGGGVRSVMQLRIVKEVEQITEQAAHQVFDFMGGISAGGLVVLGLTTPNFEKGSRRRHQWTAEKLLGDHPIMMQQIFQTSPIASIRHMSRPKYDPKLRDAAFQHYLGNTLMKDALTPIAIPAIKLKDFTPVIFTKHTHGPERMVEIAAKATTALTYFATTNYSLSSEGVAYGDAGMACNNPIITTCIEAQKWYPGRPITILSIGTGYLAEDYLTPSEINSSGYLSHPTKCLNSLWQCGTNWEQKNAEELFGKERILNIDFEIKPDQFLLDNANPKNIEELKDIATKWLETEVGEGQLGGDRLRDFCRNELRSPL